MRGDDDRAQGFTDFVARQATLALERAESQLVGAQYKVPRLVREELLVVRAVPFRPAPGSPRELGRDEDEVTVGGELVPRGDGDGLDAAC